ncbi:14255_t:CDS:2 [Ambispora leptoticha]|uniref:14255_t:CDS:1 n=1 Tax=Ambispora leptoticha TaxID=144679 RepID=A0A9N9F1M0_9GLOM|nr:14255_t:CDS:2 [Ambispora leptoticha]
MSSILSDYTHPLLIIGLYTAVGGTGQKPTSATAYAHHTSINNPFSLLFKRMRIQHFGKSPP